MMDDDEMEHGFIRRLLPRRPKDAVCLGLAVVATGYIAVNALFLQSGPHPAPIFTEVAQPATAPASDSVPMPPPKRQASTRLPAATLPTSPVRTTASVPAAPAPMKTASTTGRADNRPDPIAELLEPSNRTIAVQRALAEFGYGQIKPTGTVGPETRAAIEKFERERKLPVTGQVSERLTRELSALKGGPL
jgi:hypothetical protein